MIFRLNQYQARSCQLDDTQRAAVADEMADVVLYLVQLGNVQGVDRVAAAWAKLERNGERYPVDQARGNGRKYDRL